MPRTSFLSFFPFLSFYPLPSLSFSCFLFSSFSFYLNFALRLLKASKGNTYCLGFRRVLEKGHAEGEGKRSGTVSPTQPSPSARTSKSSESKRQEVPGSCEGNSFSERRNGYEDVSLGSLCHHGVNQSKALAPSAGCC